MSLARSRERLIEAAMEARRHAFCPLTRYPVGAAVLAASGRIYPGCNVESPTGIGHVCAERAAIYAAVSHGERSIKAVCTSSWGSVPCGTCRQMILEFGSPKTKIYSLVEDGRGRRVVTTTIAALLPRAHTKSQIRRSLR